MKIFQIDSPLMKFLGKVADIAIVNLFTVLLFIPVITAGAAFTAMHYCMLKLVRDEEAGIVKQYFHSFKDNFKQSTIIWLLFLVLAAFFGVDFYLMYVNPTGISSYVLGGTLVFAFLVMFIGVFVYPIQAKFVNTIPKTLKTAFVFSFRHFPITLLILIAEALPFALFFIRNIGFWFFPLELCFCFSAPAFLAAKLYNKHFKKAEDVYFEAHPEENPSADDEHIFSDEMIIPDDKQ
ncbi:MAG: DUF624 domain-containing protein [Lachnospiraceae bacterium]|nr:DUF624 domain-containing protein [Lachnospiraceae bacterium]